MKQMIILVLIGIVLIHCCHCVTIVNEENFKKVIHNTDPDAVCLDGSSPALFIHQGKDPNKILIVLEGGGFCQGNSASATIESCYKRSKTDLGSSKKLPNQLPGQGILSTNPSISDLSEWTKVYIPYCDGSLFQGYRKQPVKYKDAQIYFRGSKLMRANFKYIDEKFNIKGADKVVLSGFSAGAVGAILWADYLKSMVSNPNNLYIVPDSGIFISSLNYETKQPVVSKQMMLLTQLANLDEGTPLSECNSVYKNDQLWKCLMVQFNYPYQSNNFLFINSEYDAWGLEEILGMKCVKQGIAGMTLHNCNADEREAIQEYRRNYIQLVQTLYKKSENSNFWSISCSWHVYTILDITYNSQIEKVPELIGVTPKQAVAEFVVKGNKVFIQDLMPWPFNVPCAR